MYARITDRRLKSRAREPKKSSTRPYLIVAYAATAAHLLNLVGMLVIYWSGFDGQKKRDSCFQTTVRFLKWSRVSNETVPSTSCGASSSFNTSDGIFRIEESSQLTTQYSLHWLIVLFHALSFIFQGVVLVPRCYDYEKRIDKGTNSVRFFEYSISASVMLICLALLNGITDQNELIMIAVLCGITQLCGLATEILLSEATTLKKNSVAPGVASSLLWTSSMLHFSSWATLLTAYGVIWRYFLLSASGSEDSQPPAFVYAIVMLLCLLFISFGAVQVVQISRYAWCQDRCRKYPFIKADLAFNRRVELYYTLLSLVAKTLLGWMLYYNVLAMASDC